MKIGLSPFLQWRFNLFLYLTFGWKVARFYVFFLGNLYFFLNQKEKNRIENALSEVIGSRNPASHIAKIKKEVFKNILSHYYEKLFIAYEEKERAAKFLKERIFSDDLKKLNQKLSKGKGVIMVSGHYGAIEYIPTLLAVHNLPVSMIAKFKTEHLRKKIFEQAEKYHITMIDAEASDNVLITAMNELRKNRILVTQCDEVEEWRPSDRQKTSFLGRTVGVDRTINIMKKRSGAEIVFGVIHRYTLDDYQLMVYDYEAMLEILNISSTLSVGEILLKFLERCIYKYPEQWYEWKKYYHIKTFPVSNRTCDSPALPFILKPTFGKVT